MHRFLLFMVLMLGLYEPPMVRADELRFYYFQIDAETFAPVTREAIRHFECQGVIEEPASRAVRSFASGALTRTIKNFEEYGVRILVEGPDIVLAMDKLRHFQVDMKSGSTIYSLTEIQLDELLEKLTSNPVAKRCIENDPSRPFRRRWPRRQRDG